MTPIKLEVNKEMQDESKLGNTPSISTIGNEQF